jgi:hypothetical protein
MLSARDNYCPDQVTSSGAEPSHPTTIVVQYRKRPATTSTLAKTAHKPFRLKLEKDLPILKFVDDYNHYIGYVD